MIIHFMELYTCKSCGWQGKYDELEWDRVDTCMGYDSIACCPSCGNPDLKVEKLDR